ncbi:hypothetical protein BWI92_01700 [Flectobacillus sp. BAB-3569]|nr:hypothetical protein BWI92_01700 [Flectobacillus sp. BAB-3569]
MLRFSWAINYFAKLVNFANCVPCFTLLDEVPSSFLFFITHNMTVHVLQEFEKFLLLTVKKAGTLGF